MRRGVGSTIRNFSLYRSPDIVREIESRILRWASHLPKLEECRNALKLLTGKPKGKKYLGKPRHREEDNIRMNLKEIGVNMRNLVDSVQYRGFGEPL